jgi:hypothetical protein
MRWLNEVSPTPSMVKKLERPGESKANARAAMMWNTTTIRKIVTNPTYLGKRRYDGEQKEIGQGHLFDANRPALIEPEVFEQCLRRAAESTEKNTQPSGVRHLLSCLMVCGKVSATGQVCGQVVKYRNWATRPNQYYCPNHLAIRADLADLVVETAMIEWLSDPERMAKVLSPDRDAEIVAWRRRAAMANAAYREFLDASPRMSPLLAARQEPPLLAAIEEADAALRALVAPGPLGALTGPGSPESRWKDATLATQRAAIALVFPGLALGPSPTWRTRKQNGRASWRPEPERIIFPEA